MRYDQCANRECRMPLYDGMYVYEVAGGMWFCQGCVKKKLVPKGEGHPSNVRVIPAAAPVIPQQRQPVEEGVYTRT